MSLLLAGVLLLIGLGVLFIAPWVGAGFLAAALVLGLVGSGWMIKNADEVVVDESPAEPPHMPGPGNPQSGVD
jgi:dipeptide/tripeptide permease